MHLHHPAIFMSLLTLFLSFSLSYSFLSFLFHKFNEGNHKPPPNVYTVSIAKSVWKPNYKQTLYENKTYKYHIGLLIFLLALMFSASPSSGISDIFLHNQYLSRTANRLL